jgi:hypothetical protein
MTESELKHVNFVLPIDQKSFQAICGCGWTSTINYFEHVDLLRAMHAHAVVTFQAYA